MDINLVPNSITPKLSIVEQLLATTGKSCIGDIGWAYAANSKEAVESALNNPKVDYLEVDVSLSSGEQAIAAHPPLADSDVLIAELLENMRGTDKSIKFDFKTIEAARPVMQALLARPLPQTVLLNADVLTASGAKDTSINAEEFITICRPYTNAIFSLGWCTDASPSCTYTYENVREMLSVCAELGHVTFPVRATMLPRSWDNVQLLLTRPDSSLTIWESLPIDTQLKAWLRQHTDQNKCFYEVEL